MMRRQRSRRWRTGTAVGALGLALAGCGVFDDGQGGGTAEEADDGQDDETADASDSVDEGQPQEPPEEEDPPDYGEVVATRDYSDSLDVEVYPVRRDGRVMTIRYGVVNETSDSEVSGGVKADLQNAALTDLDGFEQLLGAAGRRRQLRLLGHRPVSRSEHGHLLGDLPGRTGGRRGARARARAVRPHRGGAHP